MSTLCEWYMLAGLVGRVVGRVCLLGQIAPSLDGVSTKHTSVITGHGVPERLEGGTESIGIMIVSRQTLRAEMMGEIEGALPVAQGGAARKGQRGYSRRHAWR